MCWVMPGYHTKPADSFDSKTLFSIFMRLTMDNTLRWTDNSYYTSVYMCYQNDATWIEKPGALDEALVKKVFPLSVSSPI